MKANLLALVILATAAIAARGDITPSNDTSGASDAAAIQSAIDTAANGGTVTLGSGMFYINSQLNVTNGVTLAGQGWENTVIKQVATTPSAETRVVTVSGGAKIERVTLTGGRVTGSNDKSGGGAYVSGGTVSWCCITNNSVSEANVKYGGGIGFSHGAGGQVDHCVIADNSVSTSTSDDVGGGGIGAYQLLGPITIDSCLISGNRAIRTTGFGKGGGIGIEFMYQQYPVVVRNTTIVGNTAGEGEITSKGGAVFTSNDSGKKFAMLNCIIAGNTTAGAAKTMDLNYDGGVDYCFFGIEADKIGGHSLFGAPQFIDAENGDYHLASSSPAREAGVAYSGIGVDLDNVAFLDPPSMGCYQSGGLAKVDAPVFDPASGTKFYPSTNVTLSCATAGASIYYTLDGTDPTDASTLYSAPIAISATTTIKARAYKADMAASSVVAATYVYKAPAPMPDGFRKYVEITLTTNLAASAITTGIPALVKLSESAISGFDYDDFSLAKGGDMMFVDENNEVLPHEIDTWDTAGESLVWVKLPSTAAGTAITMYYGSDAASSADSTDVWTGYNGVWHFESATADTAANSYGMYANSTATAGIDGHIAEHTKTNETGRFGKCFRTNDSTGWKAGNFNYGGVWVNDSGANSPIDGGQNFTISGWFKHDQVDYYWDHIFYKRSRSDNATSGAYVNAFAIECNSSSGSNPQIYPRGSSNNGKALLSENQGLQNTWAYLTFVYDGAAVRVFKNGAMTDWVTIDACVDNDAPLVFGNNCNVAFGTMGDAAWNGWIDEVRFSKGSKDAEWIAAEYAAMNASATDIFSYGAAQSTGQSPVDPPKPIVLGVASATPGAGYNGSSVTVSFTGDIPDGATVAASIAIGGVDYAGTVDAANGVVTFDVPADVVTAGNTYEGTITLAVGNVNYTTDVSFVQGRAVVDVDNNWIDETASTFGTTGTWSGDKAQVVSSAIAVSNATFTAATVAPTAAVVTVTSTFRFGDPSDEPYDVSSRAGITVVEAGGVNRYAVLTASGAVTNLSVAANIASAVEVTVTLDCASNTVAYSVGGVFLGTFPMTVKATGISTVHYDGPAEVSNLEGAYCFEGLGTNSVKAGDTEYATLEEAIASGKTPVELLWDASWTPAAVGEYTIKTNGHSIVIGGNFAHSIVDNGNGTVTITITEKSAGPKQPVVGSRTGSNEVVGLSTVKGEGNDDNTYLVIPFAAEAGFTYTLKTSTSLLTPVAEWTPAAGVSPITLSADGDAEFRVPMGSASAFFVISVE